MINVVPQPVLGESWPGHRLPQLPSIGEEEVTVIFHSTWVVSGYHGKEGLQSHSYDGPPVLGSGELQTSVIRDQTTKFAQAKPLQMEGKWWSMAWSGPSHSGFREELRPDINCDEICCFIMANNKLSFPDRDKRGDKEKYNNGRLSCLGEE